MKLQLKIIAGLAMATAIGACGGNGNSGDAPRSGDESTKEIDESTREIDESTREIDESTREITVYSNQVSGQSNETYEINFDTENEAYSIMNSDGEVVEEGEFDDFSSEGCATRYSDFCGLTDLEEFEDLSDLDLHGEGLVWLDHRSSGYYGYGLTPVADMPSSEGDVDYVGRIHGGALDWRNADGSWPNERSIDGKAVTTVNFGQGTLDADFTDFSDRGLRGVSAHIRDAQIDGNMFHGGSMAVKVPNGFSPYYHDLNSSVGQFFGDEAQALGGTISYIGDDFEIEAAWIGTQE